MRKKLFIYFSELNWKNLSVHQKKDIYESFIMKKRFSSNFSKVAFRSWVAFFLVIFVSLLSFLFVWEQNQPLRELDEIWNWFVSVTRTADQWLVFANAIAQILQTTWEIELYHDWNVVDEEILRHSDRVIMYEGAEITFLVQNDVQAVIFGPAEFEVLQSNQKDLYTINMISWTYIELTSTVNAEQLSNSEDDDRSLLEDVNNNIKWTSETESFQVQVVSDVIEIVTPHSNEHIDVVVYNEEWHHVVENIGEQVTLKKSIESDSLVTSVKSNQIASILNEIEIFDSKNDSENVWMNIYDQIQLWELKIVYSSSINFAKSSVPTSLWFDSNSSDVSWWKKIVNKAPVIKESTPIDKSTENNKISKDVENVQNDVFSWGSVSVVSKRVLSKEQLSIYNATIWSSTTIVFARQLMTSVYQWDTWSLSQFMRKFQVLLSTFSYAHGLDYVPSVSSISSLLNSVDLIQAKLNDKYYVSPSMNSEFQKIRNWLLIASKVEFGSAEYCDLLCLKSTLPLTASEKMFLSSQ